MIFVTQFPYGDLIAEWVGLGCEDDLVRLLDDTVTVMRE